MTAMKIGVLCMLWTAGMVQAVIQDSYVSSEARGWIVGQIGDPYLWGPSINGGYILKFSADIDNDGRPEDFIGTTMGENDTECEWSIYSDGNELGGARFCFNGFTIILNKNEIDWPRWDKVSPLEISVQDQILKDDRITSSRRIVDIEDFAAIQDQWNSAGKKINPKVEAILLTDYVAGDRNWREINHENYKTTLTRQPYLKEDEERLSQQIAITPEQALAILEKSGPISKRKPKDRWVNNAGSATRESKRAAKPNTVSPFGAGGVLIYPAILVFGILSVLFFLFRKASQNKS